MEFNMPINCVLDCIYQVDGCCTFENVSPTQKQYTNISHTAIDQCVYRKTQHETANNDNNIIMKNTLNNQTHS